MVSHRDAISRSPVDGESASRMYSMLFDDLDSTSPEAFPIAGAYDFEAAFPSVIHEWIGLVLHHRKMPADYISVFKASIKMPWPPMNIMVTFSL